MNETNVETRLEIRGIGRWQFLAESVVQWFMVFFGLVLMMGGTAWMTAMPEDPAVIEQTLEASGMAAVFGMFMIFSAWVWSLFTWYRRLVNMGYGFGVFLLVMLVSYLTAGLVGIILWLWLLFAGPRPQMVYIVKEESK